MIFERLDIEGAALVRLERLEDGRGFFARTYCVREFAAFGIDAPIVQTSLSYNARAGTVRGLHFQWPPSREGKVVRCARGAVHDVLLDLRPESASYLRHVALRLDDERRDALYVPPGVAHGFMTLADGAEVHYQMSDLHAPELAAGVRWDDPAFGIRWPQSRAGVISDRDAGYPDFDRGAFEAEIERRRGARS
jgi:dTDP-4-dehydrorhamnose 3,5-epimerase